MAARRRRGVSVVGLVGLYLLGARGSSHAAPAASLLGRFLGVPSARHATTLTGVAAVDASSGEAQAAGTVHRGRFRLAVPPGIYLLRGSVVRPTGGYSGIGPLVAAIAGRRTEVDISFAPVTVALSTPVAAAAAANAGNTVATMGDVTVQNPAPYGTALIDGTLFTPIFDRSRARCRLRWVDTHRDFLDARERELELQQQGRLDPSTPVRDELLAPAIRVEGTFTNDLRRTSGELRVVDLRTGQVILRKTFAGPTRDLERLIDEWGRRFASALCDLLAPPSNGGRTTTTLGSSTTTSTTVTTTTVPASSGTPCATSTDCGKTGCCNPVHHACCDWVHPDDPVGCSGGAMIFSTSLGCSYNENGTTPYTGQPCGPHTPPVCPSDAQSPVFFECSTCVDDGKYVSRFCNVTSPTSACVPSEDSGQQ